jgi:hypothetical protein
MDKKQIGLIMMIVAGVTLAITLYLLIKWYPIHVSLIVFSMGLGFGGYKIFKS